MKTLNNTSLDCQASPGERLTLTADDHGTGAVVTCSAAGKNGTLGPGLSFSFDVDAGGPKLIFLIVTCSFRGPAGAFVDLNLESNAGGSAPYTVNQQGLIINTVAYSIDVA